MSDIPTAYFPLPDFIKNPEPKPALDAITTDSPALYDIRIQLLELLIEYKSNADIDAVNVSYIRLMNSIKAYGGEHE